MTLFYFLTEIKLLQTIMHKISFIPQFIVTYFCHINVINPTIHLTLIASQKKIYGRKRADNCISE